MHSISPEAKAVPAADLHGRNVSEGHGSCCEKAGVFKTKLRKEEIKELQSAVNFLERRGLLIKTDYKNYEEGCSITHMHLQKEMRQRMSRQRGGVRPKGAPSGLPTMLRKAAPVKTFTQRLLSSRPTGRVIPSRKYTQIIPLIQQRSSRTPYYKVSTLLNEVYNSIKIALPSSTHIDCEDYVYFLYNYFIYIGETPLDPTYLYSLLTDATFMSGNVTLDDFKRHYDSFAMTGSPVYSEEDVLPQIDNYSLLSPFQGPISGSGSRSGSMQMGGRRNNTLKRRKYPRGKRHNRRSLKCRS